MTVPPFIPQPVEIRRNVTTERYPVMVGFVRRVSLLHFLSVLFVAGVAALPSPWVDPSVAGWATLGLLVALSLARTLARGRRVEVVVSGVILVAFLVALGSAVRVWIEDGWPLESLLVGVACAVVYVSACGRDLSYVGMLVLSILASSGLIVAGGIWLRTPGLTLSVALSLNALYLIFYVYDLASLLSRRRLGEEIGAVADLYRDVLNLFGYLIRVAHHWRRHRIWLK
ncbi:MAG TPA: hypothetical protein PLA92_06210 [Fimbriimonadaceae bacterium]|nr:hypothetical protein [Fimbriimonadaceae bacterium]